ncbi:hypothetical protein ACI2KS_29400, partial [Pseudomonas sp. NPDC087358]|uniref:hypothetical protein n=1 Tax=Pseudomonas sp. NPDC087358 TaxID=3364439 RepID=UPI00384F2436
SNTMIKKFATIRLQYNQSTTTTRLAATRLLGMDKPSNGLQVRSESVPFRDASDLTLIDSENKMIQFLQKAATT